MIPVLSPGNKTLTPVQSFYLFWKRFIDIAGSIIGIIVLSPLLLIVTILTAATSRGPILFKQKRLGKHKRPFTIFKFRSMRADAPQVTPADITPEQQKSMTTPWGGFIRKTSIDEIPQLFNIFVGQMSFIGPRPCQTEDIEGALVKAREEYSPNAFDIKPGLSGYAQVHMKRDHDIYEKAKFDHYYVEHLSLILDIKIFLYSILCALGIDEGR